MVCFEDEFVVREGGCEQEPEVKDTQDQGVDTSADRGQWEESVGWEEGEERDEDLQDMSRAEGER